MEFVAVVGSLLIIGGTVGGVAVKDSQMNQQAQVSKAKAKPAAKPKPKPKDTHPSCGLVVVTCPGEPGHGGK